MTRFTALVVVLLWTIGAPTFAAVQTEYVGFVDSSVWFEREPFFSGETVRIYTTLANSSQADFNGTVTFYDREKELGSTTVTLERQGGFQVVWNDWVPTEGDHQIGVRITRATLTLPGEAPQEVVYAREPLFAPERFVDRDTDKDGVGDRSDADDDGDGIPDTEDAEPLIPQKDEGVADSSLDVSFRKELESKTADVVLKLGEAASSTMPQILSGVRKVAEAIEDFRTVKRDAVKQRVKEINQETIQKRETAALNPELKGESKNEPFNQLKLLALTAAGYTLSSKIAFYLALILILYVMLRKVIPFLYSRMRRKTD